MGTTRLQRFPKLEAWFLQASTSDTRTLDLDMQTALHMCRTLSFFGAHAVTSWEQLLQTFILSSPEPARNFLALESFLASCNADLLELASEFAEDAVKAQRGKEHYELLKLFADQSGLSAIRFLAAWTAFNCNDPDSCIEQCDLIGEPFGCVYTLQGQAMLELGDPEAAIENLNIAIEISPEETLAHFQLAKALFVKDRFAEAYERLCVCDKLSPSHPEIDYMLGLSVLNARNIDGRKSKLELSLSKILAQIAVLPTSLQFIYLAHDIIFELGDVSKLERLYELIDWPSIKSDPEFLRSLPQILRRFEGNAWQQHSVHLLNHLVPQA